MIVLSDGLDQHRHSARTAAARLADVLAVPPPPRADADYGPDSPRWNGQSLSRGAAGIAVLHGLRARDRLGGWDRALAWFACALREELSAAGGAGLWHGAPAVAFALHTAAPVGEAQQLLDQLDAAVVRMVGNRLAAAACRIAAAQRPLLSEFDLVRGLTGLGAYLLRRDPHGEPLRAILTYLVRLTDPVPADDPAGADAPGWWTCQPPAGKPPRDFTGGHCDQGMAHGISGPLSLLALALRVGIAVDGQVTAIETICAWLDAWRLESPAGPWWPERITLTELRASRSRHHGPARPSWCYGTPGIARALQLAAAALDDPVRQQLAEDALLRCITDSAQLDRLDNPALCHGRAGLIATTWFAAADSPTPALSEQLPALLDALLHHMDPNQEDSHRAPGLIEGSAGVALVLHSISTATFGGWETSLLLT